MHLKHLIHTCILRLTASNVMSVQSTCILLIKKQESMKSCVLTNDFKYNFLRIISHYMVPFWFANH